MKTISFKGILARVLVLGLAGLPGCGRGTPASPGTSPPTGVETTTAVTLDVLVIGALAFPVQQFHQTPADRCDAPHWHAHGPVFAIGLTSAIGTVGCGPNFEFPQLSDPDPGGCGFGRVSEVPVRRVLVPLECHVNWLLTQR